MESHSDNHYSFVVKLTNYCNLSCSYCYYLHKSGKHNKYFAMPENILEQFIEKSLLSNHSGTISYYWHGGEPLLVGKPVIDKIICLQNKYNIHNANIINSIQTNGTLLDEEWIDLLTEHGFTIGLSIDGPRALHLSNRKFKGIDKIYENELYDQLLKNIDLLIIKKSKFGVLSVISNESCHNVKNLLSFYIDNNINNVGFLPVLCLNQDRTVDSEKSLSPHAYSDFIINFFDLWLTSGKSDMIIREIDEYIKIVIQQPTNICYFNNECNRYFTILPDGDIYLCDNLPFIERFKLGNIVDGFSTIKASKKYHKFSIEYKKIDKKCGTCDYFRNCNGGCSFERLIIDGNLFCSKNYYCEAYKMIFKHIDMSLNKYNIPMHCKMH